MQPLRRLDVRLEWRRGRRWGNRLLGINKEVARAVAGHVGIDGVMLG